jgi:hypothetical protein
MKESFFADLQTDWERWLQSGEEKRSSQIGLDSHIPEGEEKLQSYHHEPW